MAMVAFLAVAAFSKCAVSFSMLLSLYISQSPTNVFYLLFSVAFSKQRMMALYLPMLESGAPNLDGRIANDTLASLSM